MCLAAEGRHRQSEAARWKRRLSGEGGVHRDRGGSMGVGCVIRCGHEMYRCEGRDEHARVVAGWRVQTAGRALLLVLSCSTWQMRCK
jgi:hypothetical protein